MRKVEAVEDTMKKLEDLGDFKFTFMKRAPVLNRLECSSLEATR